MIKQIKTSYNYIFLVVVILLVLEYFLTLHLPFFWDGLTKSIRANWIYENNFKSLIVPNEINSGHPPLWIFLLSFFWKIFDQTLAVSRLLLLIINIGVAFQIINLFKFVKVRGTSILFVFIVFLEPTLIAQTTSLNNDMLLLFFCLLSLNSIIKNNYVLLTIGLSGLLLTNLRGIYMYLGFVVTHFLFIRYKFMIFKRSMLFSYGLSIILLGMFCFYQYQNLGWFILKDFEHREVSVNTLTFIKNIFAYFKSFVDYGRVVLIFLVLLKLKSLISFVKSESKMKFIFIPFIVFLIILFFGTVPTLNPAGERYYMFCFILLLILIANFISRFKYRYRIVIVLTVAFITGHFWVYPVTLSQPWDASLAYTNYFAIKDKMKNYIYLAKIKDYEIGTRLPINDDNAAYLDKTIVHNYSEFDLNNNKYVFISNIDNNTKDEDILEVLENWKHLKTYSQLGVFISIYKNPMKF